MSLLKVGKMSFIRVGTLLLRVGIMSLMRELWDNDADEIMRVETMLTMRVGTLTLMRVGT